MMVVRVGSRPRVGIQGVRASFHDVAARSHFRGEEIELVEYPSFGLLGSGLASGEADLCLMAIENSIAGSILPNYSLLEKFGFKIQGEVYLRIEMCLLALPGDSIESIRYVKSHPMAIFQCEEFLSRHSWMSVLEGPDTADSAREIAENRAHGYAAIASSLAAEVYDLNLLQQGIETDKRNYTRFLVICRSEDFVQDPLANKASVRFETSHQPGSLADVLDVLRSHRVNMTKIQSVPILGRPYEYSFHVDLEWDDPERYREAMRQVETKVINLVHFGDYPRGERPV